MAVAKFCIIHLSVFFSLLPSERPSTSSFIIADILPSVDVERKWRSIEQSGWVYGAKAVSVESVVVHIIEFIGQLPLVPNMLHLATLE